MKASNIEELMSVLETNIRKKGLQLMDGCYARDLTVHDRHYFETNLVPGISIGWCVGHHHSHCVILGVMQEENELVSGLTNLANDDCFYVIKSEASGITVSEKSKTDFEALIRTPIPFQLKGDTLKKLYHQEKEIGSIQIDRTGTAMEPVWKITIAQVEEITAHECVALGFHAERSAVKAAGSFFIKTEKVHLDAYRASKVAA